MSEILRNLDEKIQELFHPLDDNKRIELPLEEYVKVRKEIERESKKAWPWAPIVPHDEIYDAVYYSGVKIIASPK